MHRISTDSDYLKTGKVVIDADGVPVDVPDRTHMEAADMALGQRIDGKADTGHTHTSASITDAVSRISNIPNRLVKTDAEGKLFILTTSITNQGDPTNKAFVEAQVKAVRDLLPTTIRVGQGVKWDGAKFIPSWLDRHANLYDNTY